VSAVIVADFIARRFDMNPVVRFVDAPGVQSMWGNRMPVCTASKNLGKKTRDLTAYVLAEPAVPPAGRARKRLTPLERWMQGRKIQRGTISRGVRKVIVKIASGVDGQEYGLAGQEYRDHLLRLENIEPNPKCCDHTRPKGSGPRLESTPEQILVPDGERESPRRSAPRQ